MQMLFWCIRKVICCARLFTKHLEVRRSYMRVTKIPWLWVGAERAGHKYTVTDLINSNLVYNIPIDTEYLTNITKIYNVDRWLYLDPMTLQELEFPLEGFVIENDTEQS